MANASLYAAFERFWQHVVTKLSDKSDLNHTHDEYVTSETLDEVTTEVGTVIGKILDGTTVVPKAEHAANADMATTATKATQDAKGNVIDTTYATKTEVQTEVSAAQTYVDNALASKSSIQFITWEEND